MTVMGTVKNGVVVLDQVNAFAEGERVKIYVIPTAGRGATLKDLVGTGPGWDEAYPGEMDAIREKMKADERADAQRSIERGE